MRSSVYINELSPGSVSLDLSASPSALTSPDNHYGFAFLKTVEHLGLEARVDPQPVLSARLEVAGSVDTIKSHLPNLQRHIGLIARYGSRLRPDQAAWLQEGDKRWIGSTLGRLVQHKLPGLPADASLMRAMGVVIEPFADATNDDGVLIYYARPFEKGNDYTPVQDKGGFPLRRFGARDIGGLLIGPDGLPAQESFMVTSHLSGTDVDQLRLIAAAKKSVLGKEISYSLRRFVDKPDKTPIKQTEAAPDVQNLVCGFWRTDLEAAMMHDMEPGATLGDAIRTAVAHHLALSAADPELQAEIASEKQRSESELLDLWRADI